MNPSAPVPGGDADLAGAGVADADAGAAGRRPAAPRAVGVGVQHPPDEAGAVGDGLAGPDAAARADVEGDRPVEAAARAVGDDPRGQHPACRCRRRRAAGVASCACGAPVGLQGGDLPAQHGVVVLQLRRSGSAFVPAAGTPCDPAAHRAEDGVGAAVQRAERAAHAAVGVAQAAAAEVEGDEAQRDGPSGRAAAIRCRRVSCRMPAADLAAMAVDDDLLQLVEVLDDGRRAEHDRVERAVGDVHRHAELVLQAGVQAAQQRAAAGEHDAAGDEVAGQLGRAAVEGGADGRDDAGERRVHRLAQLVAGDR